MMKTQTEKNIRHRFLSVFLCPPFPVVLSLILFSSACVFSGERKDMDHFRSLNIRIPAGSALRLDENNGTVNFLRGENLSENMEDDKAFEGFRSKALLPQIAMAFLSAHHRLLKLNDPFHELKTVSLVTDDLGYTHIKFQQVFESIPILNAEISVHLNRLNQVNSVNGRYIPTPSGLNTTPAISQDQAIGRVAENFSDKASTKFEYVPELIVYASAGREPRLAYRVAVHSNIISGKVYIIDAGTGDLLTEFSTIYNAKP
jgi:Zn-dependent metalloprotease